MKDDQSSIKVLHLFANLNLGGAESRIMDIYRTQNESDVINDFVVMTQDTCYFTDEIIASGGKIHTINNPRNSLLTTLWQLFVLLRTQPKYDAIHSHTSYFSGIVMFIAWLSGIKKRVSHARNQSLGHLTKKNGFILVLGRWLCNCFSTTKFAISTEAGKFLYGNSNFKVVANAFNFKKIKHISSSTKNDKKQENKVNTNTLNIISVARFSVVKNHIFILNIAKSLLLKEPNVCFHFIGEGENKEHIQKKVHEMNLQKHVRFWGARSDIHNLLFQFDVMLMPSINEGLGVAALEAQAAGIPCILSTGVPKEADINVNLCTYLNLNQPTDDWVNAILNSQKQQALSKSEIDDRFTFKNYDLQSSRNTYRDSYL